MMALLIVLLKVLCMILLLAPALPGCFFFLGGLGSRYPRNKREWIIGVTSLAYLPVYFEIIHHWPDLKL
jgi:hypothetical protein